MNEVKRLLSAIGDGDAHAADILLPVVYDELRQLAQHRLAAEAPNHTLQPTALVHEAYLRLLGPDGVERPWENEAHFFGAAAEAMRRILIDRARAKRTEKRGGDRARATLDLNEITLESIPEHVLEIDEALQKLAQEEPAKAELVKLRFFAGLSLRQAAAVLKISSTTADRHWSYARAWLRNELKQEG